MFNWIAGRQGTGYFKMLLLQNSRFIPFDIYLLKFPEGSYIDWHTDPVPDYNHYRINWIVKTSEKGGEFISKSPIFTSKYLNIMRPDIDLHCVTKIEKGTRYVLSLGWVLSKSWNDK